MNNATLEKLNYKELKEIVKSYCVSNLGKKLIDKLVPSNNIKQVRRMIKETSEGRRLIDASYHMPLEGVFDISPLIEKIEKGGVLEPSEVITVGDFLRGCRKVKAFIKDKEGYAETLSAYGENITDLKYIEDEINMAIRGTIVDSNATKELKKIRRSIELCEEKIKEKIEKFIKNQSNKEYMQEFFVSIRNGRYTVPIKAAYKNHVQGTIVEASSKGTTVFMEPASVSKYTTELIALKAEESVEEYKILSTLSEMIFQKHQEIKINIEVISEYDMILAKAKYSKEISGIEPKLNDYGYIEIVKGKYPLIKECVPLDFEIGNKYRSLIITGPNAGGKTVVLKSVGLLTLAALSGFHISAHENTEIAVFDDIFVDIGDNQSVENALSTFSSHVKNLAEILKESSKNSLLLFDEIGSGTEPNEGAALAIAILEEFYHKGCITVASTHYGEIKNFSQNHPDFENAAMEFKRDTLEPLYKLHIGKSGDSNALYISRKMGISDNIIERSRKYIQTKDYNYNLVKESKIPKREIEKSETHEYIYRVGDKVLLLDKDASGIVYKEIDRLNNITVLFNNEFIEVNYRRLKLEISAEELYPKDYDMSHLFSSYKERKLNRDIERGSKKGLKKFRKQEGI
ncbi:endonuclease MutS2 [Clostridium beijerinckii]|jgi:Mismatch repair ATPase (MutS family)|uniref:Endonuclease MutS2 n=2 Tax=Clostridium beijerinckii TaxID=1520 RepID=A0AAE2RT32_CLOBE|nr:endonuclease MutS2 [Clostridium beijerinckii]ABR34282.1 DNA mismatch repair protein MutS domain protein [Clostridium beijerinckii NCIMB 8052]AIU02156.1 DNA mismatch repair protein MutS domain-containing protein [Clostridium beijerinckii ATCC 35702]MBF7811108.1 endonuclease MutS2 [Clostridium beijerinckii]NOW91847.1 dsDNA-specific endonuclease/ATPase MutS2 [Clostridium beijerinckii]NRT24409.1 dsDNA-specific endonuclease/ATPase MutS2 [Clostridium beijerinckii]